MKKIKYLFVCVWVFSSFAAISQNKVNQKRRNTDLYGFFFRHIRYPQKLVQEKVMPAVFVKIKVSSKGGIDSIGYSETSNVIKDEINRVIKMKEAEMIFVSKLNITYIIPILFYNIDEDGAINYNYKELFGDLMNILGKNEYYERTDIEYFPPLVVKSFSSGKKRQ